MSNIMAAYNPDVLSCLANLSNDEVFTPPEIANKMLDMLPQELFKSPDTKFLDPACKSGVFLREIAKRLLEGLMPGYKDWLERIDDKKRENEELDDEEKEFLEQLQATVDHIFKEQLYGIAITELTSLLARRSLYCSKYPNSDYSVTKFDDISGNIRFVNKQHRFKDGKCVFCGANAEQYDRDEGLETHAYEFIHTVKPEEILNMKFDVIISNPPYQMSDGGGMGTSATPMYNKFVEQAKKLNPRFISMIIPSRWFAGGKGLDDFRNTMLNDKRVRTLVDYFNATDCFPGVDISGGVCYFLWDRDHKGDCRVVTIQENKKSEMVRPLLENGADTFIRFNEAISIIRKIKKEKAITFENIVSARKPFGLNASDKIEKNYRKGTLSTFAYPDNGWVDEKCVRSNMNAVNKYKVFISKAYGERGNFPYLVIGKPFIGEPYDICTETYLMIGPFKSKEEAVYCQKYMATKFFRFLVLFKKNTQNAAKGVYSFVPMQDFSKPWTDEELYAKYELTQEEIDFIESMIRPMDLGGDDNG